jgi:hypothetical protein
VTAANPYGYGPQTDEERAAADEACRRAVALVAAMYAGELAGRRLTARQRDMEARAQRLARWLNKQAAKREGRT